MIKEISIENVRIFEGKGWNFPLTPLTAFCGTNNSGKSTILKVLLLLRQSMGIQETYTHEEGTLRFVGSQIDLGNYSSFVSNNEEDLDISICLTTEDKISVVNLNRLRSLKGKKQIDNSNKRVKYNLKSKFVFGTVSEDNRSKNNPSQNTVNKFKEIDKTPSSKGFLKHATFDFSFESNNLLSWHLKLVKLNENGKPIFEIMLPRSYVNADKILSKMIPERKDKDLHTFKVILQDLIPHMLIVNDSKNEEEEEDVKRIPVLPPFIIYIAFRDLRRNLLKIHYIGPLRSAAERYYVIQPDVRPRLDPTGDFLPYIFRDIDKYDKVTHIPPGLPENSIEEPLLKAVNRWLTYFRCGDKIKEAEKNKKEINQEVTRDVLAEIKIRSPLSNDLYDLVDSGFGYSQLLPILIRGLLTKENNVLIIEQPELHLNPALQLRLAEFFVSMAYNGKHVLIETHSEHIVNTIRVLTAEEEADRLSKLCSIFYVGLDKEKGRPKVKNLSVKPNGNVPNWPREFFGEASSLAGRLLVAQGISWQSDKE